jgi:hypothetical protein
MAMRSVSRVGVTLGALLATFLLQAVSFALSLQFGEVSILISYCVVIWLSWSAFPKISWLLGGACAAVLGYIYCRIDWILVTYWCTEILEQPPEPLRWRAGLFEMLAWAVAALCGIAAAMSLIQSKADTAK